MALPSLAFSNTVKPNAILRSINHLIPVSSRFWVCIFLLFFSKKALSQEIPYLINYASNTYNAAQQNWAISQDSIGSMYFANTAGLLGYNGVSWKLHTLKEEKIVRSVLADGDRIYIGAYGEFGYWTFNFNGVREYTSLSHLSDDTRFGNEEFWHIFKYNGFIFFQSFGALYKYDGQHIVKLKIPSTIMYAEVIRNTIYLPTIGRGIYKMINDSLISIKETAILGASIITGMVPYGNDRILISTNNDGAFILNEGQQLLPIATSINEELKKQQINKLLAYDHHRYVFGTISDGIYIWDTESLSTLHINKSKGLNNNTVLSIYKDNSNGLWLGLDKGITYLDLQSEMKYFKDEQENLGTIYTIGKLGHKKYIGTNQGLYLYQPSPTFSGGQFKKIGGISGQVWDLLTVDNGLICGHNTGSHFINETGIEKISDINGGWHTVSVPLHTDLLLQATYTGLLIYKKIGSKWHLQHKIHGYNDAIERIIPISSNEYWICGPIGNLKKITLSSDFTKITQSKSYATPSSGLPSIHKIQLFQWHDGIYAFSNDQQFKYDSKTDKFIKYHRNNCNIRKPSIHHEYGIFADSLVQYHPTHKSYPFRIRKDYNSIITVGEEMIFLGEDEYYSKDTLINAARKNNIPPLKFTEVLKSDSIIPLIDLEEPFTLAYNESSFTLHFSNPYYHSKPQYRYMLEGQQNEQSTWQIIDKVALKNLPPGQYTLTLESDLGQSARFQFRILPPWYLSKWMWMFYIVLIVFLVRLYRNKLQKDMDLKMKKIEEENARQLREHKIALDNEKLKEVNREKSKELAGTTMELIKKNEILVEIKEELIEIRKKDQALTLKDFQKMMKQINDNISTEHDHSLFESNFTEVHEVFFKKLIELHQDLTPQDLKLAAFLKMNLTTKEIAPLFNISVRGLENKRYRLRKKLNLDNDVNLTEYFIKIS